MNTKGTIRKILFVSMWLVICAGMLTLLIAAMGKQKKELCKGYEIAIRGERASGFFLGEEGIAKLLKTAAKGNIKGQSKAVFNLQQMEQLLEDNVWIKDAQLYFDNKSILHIAVEEREPIARVFTENGLSFYIDKEEKRMPLSEKAIARVPVFTGYPAKKARAGDDSAMLHDINVMAQYINGDSFWASQVAQVDIVRECGQGCWEYEMLPLIGRHVIKLGNGEDVLQKFRRLFAFYQQVLGRTGLDHYKTIDVRFSGQVVAAKSENQKVDSIQFSKRVNELLRHAKEMYEQELKAQEPVGKKNEDEGRIGKPDVQSGQANVRNNQQENSQGRVSPEKSSGDAKPVGQKVPKAVMPPRAT